VSECIKNAFCIHSFWRRFSNLKLRLRKTTILTETGPNWARFAGAERRASECIRNVFRMHYFWRRFPILKLYLRKTTMLAESGSARGGYAEGKGRVGVGEE
jgi:hypothetical protein